MNFIQALVGVYQQAPCEVLPNAFWKTENLIPEAACAFRAGGSRVDEIRMWDDTRLLTYWVRDPRQADFSSLDFDKMQLALVHQRYLAAFPGERFPHSTAYFRYFHSLDLAAPVSAPEGFVWQTARARTEAVEIARFIDACYPDISPAAETVLCWVEHPAYDPGLWLWLVDEASGEPAALGIADFDAALREGSLEWVQVHPAYRRRGLGQAVVLKLLAMLRGKAAFATVSGEVENPANPGGLYRRCGFEGEDIWWVLRK